MDVYYLGSKYTTKTLLLKLEANINEPQTNTFFTLVIYSSYSI